MIEEPKTWDEHDRLHGIGKYANKPKYIQGCPLEIIEIDDEKSTAELLYINGASKSKARSAAQMIKKARSVGLLEAHKEFFK